VEVNEVAETVYYLASEAGVESVDIGGEEHAVTTTHTEQPSGHGEGHEGGDSTFAPKPNLWVWTFIAFVIVVFVLKKFAIPSIMEGLDKRTEQIEGDLKSASMTKEEAEKLMADYKAQLDEARTEAKKIIDEGKSLGENLRQEAITKAQEEANQLIVRAQEEIGREKDKAIKELQSQIADISIEVASKVVQKSLSREEHGKLIDDYVAEVGKLYEG
jgi:F-type H+-transporting ATPase subunit b